MTIVNSSLKLVLPNWATCSFLTRQLRSPPGVLLLLGPFVKYLLSNRKGKSALRIEYLTQFGYLPESDRETGNLRTDDQLKKAIGDLQLVSGQGLLHFADLQDPEVASGAPGVYHEVLINGYLLTA
ncbi:unnamed protein product [Nezara viridula]|uniref:Uncharacterized protein n=1 Tax=Nezara viridula TaxID=85310 RepID=A0A9P0HMF1_NEZVI|nr:unnamed protein product [Nezara viridula]